MIDRLGLMVPLMILPSFRCQPLVGGKSYKYPARQGHVLPGTTPHCDVKTLRLGTRFHQRKEDTLDWVRPWCFSHIFPRVARAGASP